MLLIIVGVAALFLRNITFEAYVEKEERETIESQIRASQSNSRMHSITLEADPDNEEVKKLRKITSSMISNLYELRTLNSGEDWKSKLTLQNIILDETTEYKDEGGDHPLTYTEINQMLAMNQKLLDENIKPEHETYSTALPNFVKQIVVLYINFGAIIIMLLVIGEIMSSEFENHSINLLFTQPLKRTRIIVSKFWSSVILYIFTTGVILGAASIVGLVFGKKGTFSYPVLIEKNNVIEFITVSEFMIQGLMVVSATMVMVFALYLVYSLLFKHTLSTLFALLGTLLGGYALMAFISWGPVAWINPFQYLLPSETILIQNNTDWYQGIPIVLLLAIVFYLIALQKIKSIKAG